MIEFESLKPCTMTVIVEYDVTDINLNALFILLPTTTESMTLDSNTQKKQGKIIFPPNMNKPGEILSMRWNNQVRGIVRSSKINKFPHSIVLDIGTSSRIISVKLSKTIELCGPTSYEIVHETVGYIINYMKTIKEEIDFLRTHHSLAVEMREKYLQGERCSQNEREYSWEEKEVLRIFEKYSRGYKTETLPSFLQFLLSMDKEIYTGSLKVGECTCEMTNILFNLGFPVNQLELAKVMNYPPFVCNHTNIKSSSGVSIKYFYQKKVRGTGVEKPAIQTIKVNKSGHVKYSGPSLEKMRSVYYLFMERVLKNENEICLYESFRYSVPRLSPPRRYSQHEWKEKMEREQELKRRVLEHEI